jgi:hypothetical protein
MDISEKLIKICVPVKNMVRILDVNFDQYSEKAKQ